MREPIGPTSSSKKVPGKPRPPKRPKVNKAAVVLGDPLVVFGGFLRAFSRKR